MGISSFISYKILIKELIVEFVLLIRDKLN